MQPIIATQSPLPCAMRRIALLCEPTRAIHVTTAVITAKGEHMIAEQIETAPASTATEPKATKTARVGKKRANVAPKKGKSGNKATSAKKAPKARKSEKKGSFARDGITPEILKFQVQTTWN
jgi:hypothetical protein